MRNKYLKVVLLMIAAFCLLSSGSVATASQANSEITVTIDGNPIYLDTPPQKVEGRVLVPLRSIFENLGAEVKWDNKTQMATGTRDATTVVLSLNKITATVNGKTLTLDVPAKKIDGRILVPTRFVAESLGAVVKWDSSNHRVAIVTGLADSAETEGIYYFVYNSQRVTDADLAAIKMYTNKFKHTYNILLDTGSLATAPQVYETLQAERTKLNLPVSGIQLFGVETDVSAFSYVHKMKTIENNGKWDGVENNQNEKFKTDHFYSTFKNESKYLKDDISVYGILQEGNPISIVPEWPVSRLPLTKGEFAHYINNYEDYREQIKDKSVPTVALSTPLNFQDGYAQNDVGFFMQRLNEENEFNLFKNVTLRTYSKDFATNIEKENKAGAADFMIGSDGDVKAALEDKVPFLDRKNIANLQSNYYTAFFWYLAAAKGLDTTSFIHDGMVNGKLINPIALTTSRSNGGVANYIWTRVPTPEGEQDGIWQDYVAVDKELLEKQNSLYYFIYKYYEAVDSGKDRLKSFYDAKVDYAKLSEKNKGDLQAAFGFEYVIALHYLGLADYK
ncbi:copper amine oxidase N-terminal domain-containing protein [Saccharibacillus sp. CPCC 101409]|uniref:copper amine oxidase N-terminal domain-containing protein n=1 Tax=Saccharibacillus sp. CPCC 101409 TaxID=3058041 RepID=UPI0026716571|nr:copper amine oxidase N-terminal domain-containing protein [Saccharibacillus sp. CPCC 101409]MDO3409708.1 copper amine oxidase N-terminal domain-containing protein [Saccharibacillus sp. CPCC 101409]